MCSVQCGEANTPLPCQLHPIPPLSGTIPGEACTNVGHAPKTVLRTQQLKKLNNDNTITTASKLQNYHDYIIQC